VRPPSQKELFIQKAIRIGRRILPGSDLDVTWADMWIFRIDDHWFPVPEIAEPEAAPWYDLSGAAARYVQEAQDYWYFLYHPKPGDVVIDMGAGRGEDTFAFARAVGPAGRVFAFEAHPTSYPALKKFCELNRLSNVTALNLACVDTARKLHIETLPSWKQNYIREDGPSGTSFPVDGVAFDTIWRNYDIGPIDLLKMNIEGAEKLALAGSRKALEHIRNVAIATHDYRVERGESDWFRTRGLVCEYLTECGFEVVRREDSRPWARDHVHGRKLFENAREISIS
jgi:FkbM family methyltransferase